METAEFQSGSPGGPGRRTRARGFPRQARPSPFVPDRAYLQSAPEAEGGPAKPGKVRRPPRVNPQSRRSRRCVSWVVLRGRWRKRPARGLGPWNCAAQIAEKKSTKGLRPLDPRGKEVTIQGVSVRATRNPTLWLRSPAVSPKRSAERRSPGMRSQEPPRTTRQSQFHSHALPSFGAPPYPSV